MKTRDNSLIDAALARLPEWQPPPGFAARMAAIAGEEKPPDRSSWVALVLRGLAVAACVSVTAWLGGAVLAGVLSAVPGIEEALAWMLGGGSLFLAWHLGRRVARREQELVA